MTGLTGVLVLYLPGTQIRVALIEGSGEIVIALTGEHITMATDDQVIVDLQDPQRRHFAERWASDEDIAEMRLDLASYLER